jgi:hypothetical protein
MCEDPAAKVAALEAVAEAWNRRGIEYAVCHGLEGYPMSVGRDLDVVVNGRELRWAAQIAGGQLGALGFVVLSPANPWGAVWLFAFREGLALEIDLIPFLARGPALLVPGPKPAGQVGPFRVDPWASFAKRILMPILGGAAPGEPLIGPGEEDEARSACARLFGRNLAGELWGHLLNRDAVRLRQMAGSLRRSSVRRSLLLRPMRSLRLSVPWAFKTILPFVRRCAPIIALVGPDGVGKSAALHAVQAGVPEPFCGAVVRHWRPGLLPRPGSLLGRPAPEPGPDGLLPPRRHPGRLHWLRLGYYFVDFTLGHFLRDRPESSKLKVVLYDRHALDMAVDPVRYGLSSSRGARLFGRLIPSPDLVILLHDDARRIRARKQELEESEIIRQLADWRRLAVEGLVDAVLQVSGRPQDTARAVKELIVEAFLARSRRLAPGSSDPAAWLAPILGTSGAALYGRIALRGGRQYLIPAASRKAALAALRLYRPQKIRSRLAATLLSSAIRLAPADRLLPGVRLPAAGGLIDHLKAVLGLRDLILGISAGTASPHRKPVLLLMNTKGGALGYAKIGWNEQTRELVRNEREALDFFSRRSPRHGLFPRVLHFGACGELDVLVTEPLDMAGRQGNGRELQDLHVRFLQEVAETDQQRQKFGQSGFFSGILAGLREVQGAAPSYQRRVAEEVAALMGSKMGPLDLPFVWRVGDFVPWNIAVDRKADRIQAVDLEYASPRCIPGWDLFHFLSQSSIGGGDRLPGWSAALRNPAMRYFEALRIDSALVPWLHAAYLVSLWLLWTRSWSAPGVVKSAAALEGLRGKSNQLFLLLEGLRDKGAASS